jgi:hypothetical protein
VWRWLSVVFNVGWLGVRTLSDCTVYIYMCVYRSVFIGKELNDQTNIYCQVAVEMY